MREIKKRDLAKLTGNKTHWQEYRRERNSCTKNLKTTKNEHYKNLFKSYDKNNDTRSIYSTAKKLLSLKKGSSPQSFLVEGQLIRRPVDLAKIQMDYFRDKVIQLVDNLPATNTNPLKWLVKAMRRWQYQGKFPKFLTQETVTL